MLYADIASKICSHEMLTELCGSCIKIKVNIDKELKEIHEKNQLTRRLDKLERWKEVAIEKNIQDVERIRELEEFVKSWKAMPKYDLQEAIELINSHQRKIQELETQLKTGVYHSRKPHACPVCNGVGGFCSAIPNKCHSCEGKGIVWG